MCSRLRRSRCRIFLVALGSVALSAGGARGDEPPSLEECRSLLATAPEEREAALCVYRVARSEGGRGPAASLLERVSSQRSDRPWFTFYVGSLNWETSPQRAEELYREAALQLARIGDDEGEVLARINRRTLLSRLGRAREGRLEVDRILAITAESADPKLRAWGELTLARHLHETGEDLARAYSLLRGMEIPESAEDTAWLERERLVELGRVCMMIGRFREAREVFGRQVEMSVAAGDAYAEAAARQNLVWVTYELLREAPAEALRSDALAQAEKALNVSLEAEHLDAATWSAWYLGVLLPGEEGAVYLELCARLAESPQMRSLCLNPLAGRLAVTDPVRAQSLIDRSRRLAVESGDAWAELRVWQEEMRLAWEVSPPSRAYRRCWAALDAIEELRDRQSKGSEAQAGLFSIWSDDYAWLAGRLLSNLGDGFDRMEAVDHAFRVGERMRARALASHLRRMAQTATVPRAEAPGLRRVQEALAPDEALLVFQVAPWEDQMGNFAGGSWLIAVTRSAVTVHRLPGRVELRRAVDLFDGLIERRDGMEARVAPRLHEQLLAPALAELPPEVDRLILVPDDALHRLPFAALRPSPDAEPLGASHELVQVPSATLWLQWREAPVADPARSLLVLADPDSPLAGPGGEVVEADAVIAQAREGSSGAAPGEVRDAAQGLGRLPHARREGRAAVRALGDGLLLVGAEASEARLAALPVGDFGILHFAAHAVTDEDRPERSAVLLTPGGGADGLLQGAEIARLDLAGRTVVLASCRSASGSVLRGEGVMSLARAFFQAGAHGVVASLWPLRDDESQALFGRAYRHLGRGASLGEALHRARREAIEAGEPAAAWAALVVLGDGAAAPVPAGETGSAFPGGRMALWVLLGLALLAGAAAAWRLRRAT